MTGGSAPYSQTFSYNAIGNTTLKNSITFTPDAVHKHAVMSMSSGESYSYDANGNPPALHQTQCGASETCRTEAGITWKQEYDVENRLTAVKKMSGGCAGTVLETTTFAYDGDGNLVKKVNPNGSRTLYIGNVYEVNKNSGGGVTGTKNYYPAAGAMRVGSTLYFLRTDHLGSATAVTDNSGNVVGWQLYYPFGQKRGTPTITYTDRLFTGQREMTDLGIYHYNVRFYSPASNHFLSADTIVPGYGNPQDLNRFSYVLNNPLRYNDPTGHMRVEEGGSRRGCSDPKYCQDGKPKPKEKVRKKDEHDGVTITDLILQLPGSAADWSKISTGYDLLAEVTDLYAAGVVTYGFFGGAALPAPLIAVGLPEVPAVTGLAGAALAELSIQPVLMIGNALASISTGATLISETKAGNTRIEEGKFSTSSLNSMALTSVGWKSNEAFLSLSIQTVVVTNDFGWTSLPFPGIP